MTRSLVWPLALVGCSPAEFPGAPDEAGTTSSGTSSGTLEPAPSTGTGETDEPGVIDVPDASLGPTITGRWKDAGAGQIAPAGDINGDGRDDLLVKFHYFGASYPRGPAYVVFGTDSRAPILLDTSDVGPAAILLYDAWGGAIGEVQAAGDLDADGYDDLLVDVFMDFPERSSAALLGGPDPNNPTRWTTFDPAVAVRMEDFADVACSVGDVTGDGFPDHLRRWSDFPETGAELFHGGPFFVAGETVSAAMLTSTSIDVPYSTGCHALGDVNGDGLGDFAVHANGYSYGAESDRSRVHVIFGALDLPENISADALADGEGGFVVMGATPYDRFGAAVARTGDVDGDGRQDLLVGAPGADAAAGAFYLVLGRDAAPLLDLAQPQPGVTRFTAAASAERLGTAVAGGMDFNFDGIPDLAAGSPCGVMAVEHCEDQVLLQYGGTFGAAVDLTQSLDEGAALRLRSTWNVSWPDGSTAGFGSFAVPLDFDGDGALDLAIGAPTEDWNGMESGRVYIILAAEIAAR